MGKPRLWKWAEGGLEKRSKLAVKHCSADCTRPIVIIYRPWDLGAPEGLILLSSQKNSAVTNFALIWYFMCLFSLNEVHMRATSYRIREVQQKKRNNSKYHFICWPRTFWTDILENIAEKISLLETSHPTSRRATIGWSNFKLSFISHFHFHFHQSL